MASTQIFLTVQWDKQQIKIINANDVKKSNNRVDQQHWNSKLEWAFLEID